MLWKAELEVVVSNRQRVYKISMVRMVHCRELTKSGMYRSKSLSVEMRNDTSVSQVWMSKTSRYESPYNVIGIIESCRLIPTT
ncbi:MAG: hypothetical protein ACLSH8_09960 [Zhenhengia sp.]